MANLRSTILTLIFVTHIFILITCDDTEIGYRVLECTEIEPSVCNVTRIFEYYMRAEWLRNVTEQRIKNTSYGSRGKNEAFKNMTKVITKYEEREIHFLCELMPSLQEAIISNEKVDTGPMQPFFWRSYDDFGTCSNLQTLNLSKNNLTHFLVPQHNVSLVTTLNLSMNHLTDIDLSQIFNAFPNLQTLDLTGNNFHCARLETIIDQLKQRKIRFTSSGSRINCVNSTVWAGLVETPEDFNSILHPGSKKIAATELVKSLLYIVESTEHHLSKMIDVVKANLAKYKNDNEADLTRIETTLAHATAQTNMQCQELQMKFAAYVEATSQELAALNRLLYFCFALLVAFIIALTASLFKESCRSKKIGQKPSQIQPLMEFRHSGAH